jgi:hypothetical protein
MQRMIDPATGTRFAPDRVRIRTFVEPTEVAAGPPTSELDSCHRAFAEGALNVVAASRASRLRKPASGTMTFSERLSASVQERVGPRLVKSWG